MSAEVGLLKLKVDKLERTRDIAKGWYEPRPLAPNEAAMLKVVEIPYRVLHEVKLDGGKTTTLPPPLPAPGELFSDYGPRLLRSVIGDSDAQKIKRDPSDYTLAKYQRDVLAAAEKKMAALPAPVEIIKHEAARDISEFYGSTPASWMNTWKAPVLRTVGINGMPPQF